jgi:hypothetical protein
LTGIAIAVDFLSNMAGMPIESNPLQSLQEAGMATEQIGDYEIEYTGLHVPESDGWAAWVGIFGPSPNPMHRQAVFPSQHVAVETSFATEQEAEQAARQVAVDMVERRNRKAPA